MAQDSDDQQFFLRWNNFQASITSQFEALREDEDFTDVTIVCDGQRILAHRVVLSACSPLFKEIFKNNSCTHPIIFMRDIDARSVSSLLEFMYAGEVSVAQTELTNFLRTAESLKIRGLTDPNTDVVQSTQDNKTGTNTSHVTVDKQQVNEVTKPTAHTSLNVNDTHRLCEQESCNEPSVNTISVNNNCHDIIDNLDRNQPDVIEVDADVTMKQMKIELPEFSDYFTDVEDTVENAESIELPVPQISQAAITYQGYNKSACKSPRASQRALARRNNEKSRVPPSKTFAANNIVKLAEGIEISVEDLRNVKWNDYRKLTRGLASILFRPDELANCSVTGQRWSRAGTTTRPVKPALDRTKVQAIISYVTSRFPMVEISRIKQVLAYKCKENSTAMKMKARHFSEHRKGTNSKRSK